MSGLHFPITSDNKVFMDSIHGVQNEIKKTSKIVEQNGGDIDLLLSKMATGFAKLGVAFSAQQFAKKVMEVRGEFQQLEVAFTTMLGSAEKANALMAQLTRTAAVTPFGLQDVASGAKQLLAYGISAENVNETLIRLGDIAAGLSIPLGDLVYLYGTTMTQGRMFTMDLRQFMGRGIPLAEELAKIFGVAKSEVAGLVTAGKVTSDVFAQAIENMTNSGSKFGGLMEAQSKTIVGQISNIEDAIDVMFNKIGQSSEGIINAGLEGVSVLVENYEKIGNVIAVAITAYGIYKAALMVNVAIEKVQKAIMEEKLRLEALNLVAIHKKTEAEITAAAKTAVLTKMQNNLATSLKNVAKATLLNPYVAIGAAVTALGYGIYKLATYESELEKSQKKLNEAFGKGQAEIAKEVTKVNELKGKLSALKEGTKEYEDTKKELISLASTYDKGLGKEIEQVGLTKKAYDDLASAINNSVLARAKASRQTEIDQEYTEAFEKHSTKLYKELRNKLGEEKGTEVYYRLFERLTKEELKIVDVMRGNHRSKEISAFVGNIKDSELAEIRDIIYDVSKTWYGTDNAITNAIEQLILAREKQKKDTKATEVRFGGVKGIKGDEGSTSVEETKNKAYWEKLKKDAEEELHALDLTLADKDTVKKLYKNIAEADAQIAKYQVQKGKEDILSNLSSQNKDTELELLEDGYEKQRKVINREYDKTILEIQKKEKELKEKNGGFLSADESSEIQKSYSLAASVRDKALDDLAKETIKRAKENNDEMLALEREIQKSEIELMIQGRERKLKEIELTYQEELASIAQQEEDFKKKNKEFRGTEDLTLEQSAVLATSRRIAEEKKEYSIAEYDKEELESLNNYLIEYGNYEERKLAIVTKYSKLIKDAEFEGDRETLESQQEKELEELDVKFGKRTSLMADLFEDASEKSVASIQSIIDKYESLINFKTQPGSVSKEDLLSLGFTESDLEKLEKGEISIKDITDAIKSLKGELGSKSPFKKFTNDIKKAFEKTDSNKPGAVGEGITEIGSAVSSILPEIETFANSIATIFGIEDDNISNVIGLVGGVGEAAMGVGKMMSGDILGGITGAVNGVASIVKSIQAINEQAYLQEQERLEKLSSIYNDFAEEAKESIDIKFGSDIFENYEKAIKNIKSEISSTRVQYINYLTSGSFKQKAEKIYNDLGKEAKKELKSLTGGSSFYSLIDLTSIDINKLKESTHLWSELDDKTREYLEHIAKSNESIKETEDLLNTALTGVTFDSFYDSFTSMMSDMDADSKEFADNFEQYLFSAIMQSLIADEYEDDLKQLYRYWVQIRKSDMTDEERKNAYAELRNMADNIIANVEDDIQAVKNVLGISSTAMTNDEASRRGFEGMSQETASELNGRFTSLQISGEETKNQMFNVVLKLDTMLGLKTAGNTILSDIRQAHAITNGHLEDIVKIVREVKAHTSHLESIDNNLK